MQLLTQLKERYASVGHLRNSTLGVLAVAGALDQMSVTIIAPFLPIFASQYTGNLVTLGAIFAAETVTMTVLAIPFGHFSDTFGRRVFIVFGMVLSAIGVLGIGFADSLTVLLLFRILDGVGSAMRIPTTKAYLGDLIPEEDRGSAMGAYRLVEKLGLLVGPALGGLIVAFSSIRMPFLILGWGTFVAALLLVFRLPRLGEDERRGTIPADSEPAETATASGAESGSGRLLDPPSWLSFGGLRKTLTLPVLALAAITLFHTVGFGAFNTLLPLLLQEAYGMGPSHIGFLWTFSGVASLLAFPICGSLVDSHGRKHMFAAGSAIWMAVPFSFTQVTALLAPPFLLFVDGIASALLSTSKAPLDYETPPPDSRGTALGLFSSLNSAGFAIGPVLGGAIADRFSIAVTMQGASVLGVLAFVLLLWLVPETLDATTQDGSPAES